MSDAQDIPKIQSQPNDAERIADHRGENYTAVLTRLHQFLKPRNYLEIGTQSGATLALAACPSISIDPNFIIGSNVFAGKSVCHLFQMTSDAFFATEDPTRLFGGPIQFAFLDGMHWFEFLLRDFINTERHSSHNSVIAVHDCIPMDIHCARRNAHDAKHRDISNHPEWWAGDVWKFLVVLKKWRPDIKIHALDAPPTGLVLLTRLDPQNDVLQRNYFEIVEAMRHIDLRDIGVGNFARSLPVESTSHFKEHTQLSQHFWL